MEIIEKIPNIFRWILCLPAAVIAYFIANIVGVLFFLAVSFFSGFPSSGMWNSLILSGIDSFAFIFVMLIIAPAYHKVVGIIGIILINTVCAWVLFSISQAGQLSVGDILSGIAGFVGSLIGLGSYLSNE